MQLVSQQTARQPVRADLKLAFDYNAGVCGALLLCRARRRCAVPRHCVATNLQLATSPTPGGCLPAEDGGAEYVAQRMGGSKDAVDALLRLCRQPQVRHAWAA